jgi:hypoxanthine-DNA glycosylase
MYDSGFPCSANDDAKLLILGSMPSRKSLAASQYYAHPQNAFWPIMGELFDFDPSLDYEKRLKQLRNKEIALWDVAHHCVRPGSMDHAIDMQSVVANDFDNFFQTHPHIRAIFFNGRKAEELYDRLVLAKMPVQFQQLKRHLLPSSSPANAGLSRMQKLQTWEIIKDTLEMD